MERIATRAIEEALSHCDWIVIDEAGPMELKSERFIELVRQVLSSPKPALLTFQQKTRHPVVESVRAQCIVRTLAPATRDSVCGEINELLSTAVSPDLLHRELCGKALVAATEDDLRILGRIEEVRDPDTSGLRELMQSSAGRRVLATFDQTNRIH